MMSAADAPTASTSTTIQELPNAAILRMLGHVPAKQRLSCCALVSTAWAAAATAATTEVSTCLSSVQLAALSPWLQKHGPALTSICVQAEGIGQHPLSLPSFQSGVEHRRLELPAALLLPNLVRLDCRNLHLHIQAQASIGAGSSHQDSMVVALPRLQELYLGFCRVAMSDLAALQVPQLTKLVLECLGPSQPASHPEPSFPLDPTSPRAVFIRQVQEVLPSLLWQNPQLLVLRLDGFEDLRNAPIAPLAPFSALSALQHLQDCSITYCDAAPSFVQGLCSNLTALELQWIGAPPSLTRKPAHGWPHLRRLRIRHAHIDPAVLCGMQQLLHLSLERCILQSVVVSFKRHFTAVWWLLACTTAL